MKLLYRIIILLTVGGAVLTAGILTEERIITMLPLFASLFIMMYQSEANRFAYLGGGLNCILYGVVYLYVGLYASAVSTLLISMPLQIFTFLRWSKRPSGKSTVFRKLSPKQILFVVVCYAVAWVVCYFALDKSGAGYIALDNTATLLGILVSILTALAYIEYTYLWVVSALLGLGLSVAVMIDNPGYVTHVIYGVYSCVCVLIAARNVHRIYKAQLSTSER